MTNTVLHMTHFVDESLIQKLFAKFSNRYGASWTSRLGADGDWKSCEDDWLEELQRFSFDNLRAAVKKALAVFPDFPPNLGQLVDLCMKESGIPGVPEVIRLMVNRDFSHPLVKMVYDKLGSWTLTNGKEYEITAKTKEVYSGCLADFYCDPVPHWERLTSFNNQLKLEAPTPKIPSEEERKGFKERLAEYQQKLDDAKLNCKGVMYCEFDANKIKKGHRLFDIKVYNDYREYLLSIPEEQTMILPIQYLYERNRFLNAKEQPELLRSMGYNPNPPGNESAQPQRSGRPRKVYKNWCGD